MSTRLIVAVGTLALALALSIAARSMRPKALPIYGRIPDFHLVDERGIAKGASSMFGHVSVVDFIFTRCTSSCPRLTARMAELQSVLERERSGARLVSISVDPENDTPAVLSEYAAHAQADPSRWSFLTGDPQEIERAVVLGFKVSAAKVARGAEAYDVVHGDWFVVVDTRGQLRGYYPAANLADPNESTAFGWGGVGRGGRDAERPRSPPPDRATRLTSELAALVKDVLRLEREK